MRHERHYLTFPFIALFLKRGIYLVANRRSESLCANLIYSIRSSGCQLPIRLIPFGGPPVRSSLVLENVELVNVRDFSSEAHQFVDGLQSALTGCPRGFLLRFLSWFGDWDEFIYTDNDIVALMNWERLFEFLPGYDIVHGDEEYTTHGRFNYDQPEAIETMFGAGSLLSAFTAGHFLARRDERLVNDMRLAMGWFREHPAIPKKHDQALLHVALLLGQWKILNLCKPPHNWLSPWAGDYPHTLALAQAMSGGARISHVHYSGGPVRLSLPMADLATACLSPHRRLAGYMATGCAEFSGWYRARHILRRLRARCLPKW